MPVKPLKPFDNEKKMLRRNPWNIDESCLSKGPTVNDNSVWMRSLTGFGDSPAQLRAQCIHLFGIFSRLWGVDSGLAMEQARAPMWKQSNKLTLAIYGIIYAWLSLYHLCVIHSFFFGYGFQSVPCGFYVHTVDGSEIPSNNHLGCF